MKQVLLFIMLMPGLAISDLHAQGCSGSPLFHQGKQFVFLTEVQTSNLAAGQGNTAASSSTVKKTRNTYVVQSVKNQGGSIVASFGIVKSENLGPDTSMKRVSSPSSIVGAICNGHSVILTISVKSATVNFDYTEEFPSDMKMGDAFKDQTVTINLPAMAAKKGGPSSVTLIRHRSVVAEEMVTTPAGKWNCFKIAETTTTQIPGVNGRPPMANTSPTPTYTWYSADIGIIKIAMEPAYTTTLIALP
jgi:hypothetical protein